MGVVFSATHVELEHRVAIKFIRPELSQKNDVVLRFLNEARACAQLASDHIARVLDAGRTSSGIPYLAMEYLLGEDLGFVIERRGAISTHEAAGYVLQACEALAVAHAAGIVHRDIKPENLYVTLDRADRPLIKVLDFGISKRLLSEPAAGLTLPGTSLGSPEYMSPEQMSGHAVDARTDIWSLGVVLYELLTGQRPFDGQSIAEVCAAVLRDEIPLPSCARRGIDPALDPIVARCLQKDPCKRYASVAELARDLEHFAAAEPTPSQRTAAALGLALREPTRSLSEEVLNPVVMSSFPDSPRRMLPKRAALTLAAVSSSIALAAALASSTELASRVRFSSHAAGLSQVESYLPDLRHLTAGWLTPAPLGPDVALDGDLPARSEAPARVVPPSLGSRAEPAERALDVEPGAPAIPVERHARGTPANGGLSPAQIRARYQAWLRQQGLRRLSEVDGADSASADPPPIGAAELAAAASPVTSATVPPSNTPASVDVP